MTPDYDFPEPLDVDPDPYGDLADARREAAEDAFLANAEKCADCGALWDPGWHPATRIDPGYPDRTECPRCGCGDTIAQDEESATEEIRDLMVETLHRWDKNLAADRLAAKDPEDIYAAFLGPLLCRIWQELS